MRALTWRLVLSSVLAAGAPAARSWAEDTAPAAEPVTVAAPATLPADAAAATAAPESVQDAAAPTPESNPNAATSSDEPAAPGPSPTADIAPPDVPAIRVTFDTPPAAPAAPSAPAILPPDLPAVAGVAGAPDAAQFLAASDLRPVLQQLVSDDAYWKKTAHLSKGEIESLAAAYAARDYQPLWTDGVRVTPAGRAVAARLDHAEDDALDSADYPVAVIGEKAGLAALAEAELSLSAGAVAYARDARGGRIQPSRLSRLITPELEIPAAGDVLSSLATAPDAGLALAAFNPPHEGYRALRAKLAEMRHATATIAAEPAPAVAVSGKKKAAEPPRPIGIADVIANMERWRWVPRELGAKHILVNLPEFTLRVYDGDTVIHQARVIVGKPETPTPIFSHEMEYLIVNPSWYIPPSILKNEILPGLAADPYYAAKRGYEIVRRGNSISVRQPPGERNALGFIKFMFPNQHSVYLHDTPSRSLFANERRAFSHGCVRVDQPFRLAEFLIGGQGYDEARLRKMIGKGERTIRLTQKVPVHLTYFTLSVDDSGRLVRREDLYGHDRKVKTALGLDPGAPRFARLK
jgi:murein L,D-transpeptidase YcbB/YkuD